MYVYMCVCVRGRERERTDQIEPLKSDTKMSERALHTISFDLRV